MFEANEKELAARDRVKEWQKRAQNMNSQKPKMTESNLI